ncbi:MAG: Na+/H+ antiporter NhaC family protein [Elusimicrobiota bacterium]
MKSYSHKKNIVILSLVVFTIIKSVCLVFAGDAVQLSPVEINVNKFGLLTLLPPLVAIVLAFVTKNVLVSLTAGVLTGTFMLNLDGNIVKALFKMFIMFIEKLRGSLASKWNAGVILQILTIGALIAFISKTGGLKAVAEGLAKQAKTSRSAQVVAWMLGLIVFFDDYANSLIVGPVMRPVTDRLRVSREKLAFIVDATAAPVAGIALISTWIGYEVGVIRDAYAMINVDVNAYSVFVSSIPFRFYNIYMLLFILFMALLLRDFGPMLKAERRTRSTGIPYEPDAKPLISDELTRLEPKPGAKLNPWNAIIPLAVLILFTLGGFYYSGYKNILCGTKPALVMLIQSAPLSFAALREILGACDASIVMFQAAFLGCVVSIIMGMCQKVFDLSEAIDVWIKGMQALMITCAILILAWALSSVIKDLGTAKYLVTMLSDKIPAFALPTIIFLLGCLISFSTGTSYGTMGILMPLTIPLAYAISPDYGYVVSNVGAVLTGAVFGDHCSPISDTTILSSMGSSCDHMDHTETQLVYAVVIGLVAAVFGYLLVGTGINVYLALCIGTAVTFVAIYLLGKPLGNYRAE